MPLKMTHKSLTCFHASSFPPFCPLCWSPLCLPSSWHLFTLFSPSKSALFSRAKGTAQSLERISFRLDLCTKLGKEIPSRNLREKRSGIGQRLCPCTSRNECWGWCRQKPPDFRLIKKSLVLVIMPGSSSTSAVPATEGAQGLALSEN